MEDSFECYDIENLVNLRSYHESLPNLLRKLSEIFENEEIRKLCGDDGNYAKSDSNMKTSVDSQHHLHLSHSTDSVMPEQVLTRLRKELVEGNRKDFFHNSHELNAL